MSLDLEDLVQDEAAQEPQQEVRNRLVVAEDPCQSDV
jgi:hypothetical protein